LTDCFEILLTKKKTIYLLTGVKKHNSNIPNNLSQQNLILKTKTKSNLHFSSGNKCPYLSFWCWGVFLLTRVCFFLPVLFCGVYVLVTLEHFFSDVFCKTVLVKIITLFQGVVWWSLSSQEFFTLAIW
jgi:hypothetical protein